MSTKGLRQLLRERYAPPEWALFEEVANATGWGANRKLDAVAMSLWPSRGLHLHGFELKASRSDWQRERKDPMKAEALAAYMDFFWLVVDEEKIVMPGELPKNWGLLVRTGNGLVQKVDASQLEAQSLDRKILAAILRRAHEQMKHMVPKDEIADRLKEARQQGRDLAEAAHSHERASIALKSLQESIAKFKEKSGVDIDDWRAGNIGEAVKRVLEGDEPGIKKRLRFARNGLEQAMKEVDEATKVLHGD